MLRLHAVCSPNKVMLRLLDLCARAPTLTNHPCRWIQTVHAYLPEVQLYGWELDLGRAMVSRSNIGDLVKNTRKQLGCVSQGTHGIGIIGVCRAPLDEVLSWP